MLRLPRPDALGLTKAGVTPAHHPTELNMWAAFFTRTHHYTTHLWQRRIKQDRTVINNKPGMQSAWSRSAVLMGKLGSSMSAFVA